MYNLLLRVFIAVIVFMHFFKKTKDGKILVAGHNSVIIPLKFTPECTFADFILPPVPLASCFHGHEWVTARAIHNGIELKWHVHSEREVFWSAER